MASPKYAISFVCVGVAWWAACVSSAPVRPASPAEPEAVLSAEPVDEPIASASTSVSAAPIVSAPVIDNRPRIASTAYLSWLYSKPSKESGYVGWVKVGTSVPLRSPDAIQGPGCPGGWYAVDPVGYACDDATMTRDMQDPYVKALSIATPHYNELMPYRYALSGHAPMYGRLPTLQEQDRIEGPPEKRPPPPGLLKWAKGHEELASVKGGVEATDPIPEIFKDHKKVRSAQGEEIRLLKKWIPTGSMLSFSHAFSAMGRTWLVTPDLAVVPADRVRLFRTSSFQGVTLGKDWSLPLAWTRHDKATKYRRNDKGVMAATSDTIAPRTPILITANRIEDGKTFIECKDGSYLAENEIVVVLQADSLPQAVKDNEKWIEFHGKAGTMVAYQGLKPIYATLASPGEGGVGYGTNEEQVKNSTTPIGSYRIQSKERASTMSPEKGEPMQFWIADVPYTQYFRPPFAIHVAYWHEDFGMPKSAGCINVSPQDGRWLFNWTDPPPYDQWPSIVPRKNVTGLGTTVVVLP